MSYQYMDDKGNHFVRGWGNDFTDAEKKELGIGPYYGGAEPYRRWDFDEYGNDRNYRGPGVGSKYFPTTTTGDNNPNRIPFPTPGDIAREEAQDRINNPHLWGQQQAPRPGGLQRAATGFADWMTGNKWDFDQRGPGGKFLDLITKGGKNEKTGTTFSQDVENMPPIPPINPMDVMQMGGGGGIGSNEMLFDYRRPVLLDGTYEQGQGRYNPFGEQTVNGVPRTPENSSIQQDPSGPYNPFKGQTVTLPDGRVVERTPLNSSPYGF